MIKYAITFFTIVLLNPTTLCVDMENENPPELIEIEMRFQVLNESAIEQFVQKLTFLNKKRMIDIYLDTPQAELCKKGLWIRIRDQKRIDYKFNRACLADPNLEMQPYCEEHSFGYPLPTEQLPRFNELNEELLLHPGSTLAEFMENNRLIEHRTVDKIRASYQLDEFTIVVDRVDGLGTFLEFELMAKNPDNVAQIKNKMDNALAGLDLKRLKTSYDVLLLRKNNFDQYLQSRFILDEDKIFLEKQVNAFKLLDS
jgi:adenylate cyclase class IV